MTGSQTIRFFSAADLVAMPAPLDWLVRNVIERAVLALFFGDAASCKTWLALSLALAVAAGKNWMGHAVHQGAVFVLAGEGNRGLRRRLAGLACHHGWDLVDVPLYVSDRGAALSDPLSVAEVVAEVRRLVVETGHEPVLVIVDTVSRNFGAADENSTADMAGFVRGCDWLREEFGATVLLIHHVGHGDKTRARGNTTLRGALDTEYRIARDEAGVITVDCTKAKDFEAPAPRFFMLADVELGWRDDEGQPVRSAAVVPTEAPPPSASVGAGGLGRRQLEALRLLREEYARRRGNLQRGDYPPNGALVELDHWREVLKGAGFSRQQLWKVVTALQARGAVRLEGSYVRLSDDTEELP